MGNDTMQPCRKCDTENPPHNAYCRKCGAILGVSTMSIKAQPRLIMPVVSRIRWRWVGFGAAIILGLTSVLLALAALAAFGLFDISSSALRYDGNVLRSNFIIIFGLACCVLLAGFFSGGIATSWISGHQKAAEPTIAACLVMILLAVVGSNLTNDALVLAAVLILPAAIVAGIGGRIGGLFITGGKKL
jgi:hypothetical protein